MYIFAFIGAFSSLISIYKFLKEQGFLKKSNKVLVPLGHEPKFIDFLLLVGMTSLLKKT
jgi:hypothetical protein